MELVGKKAISYYFQLMSENRFYNFEFHETGVDAVKEIQREAKSSFELPYIKKDSMKLTRKNVVTIGFGHRHWKARFLTDDELKVIEKYGNDCLFDLENECVCPPDLDTKKD